MALTDKQMVSVWTEKESPPHEIEREFVLVKEWKKKKVKAGTKCRVDVADQGLRVGSGIRR